MASMPLTVTNCSLITARWGQTQSGAVRWPTQQMLLSPYKAGVLFQLSSWHHCAAVADKAVDNVDRRFRCLSRTVCYVRADSFTLFDIIAIMRVRHEGAE